MKRILFFLAIAMMVSSCLGPEWEIPSKDFFVHKFIYNGHSYIEFKDNTMYGQGYVHDPDCPCHEQVAQSLSEWDKLIMAIAWTESKFNPDADSGAGDSGLLQLRKIYCDEVNRLYGTSYTIEDAFDIDKSLEMFHLLQAHYNPDNDIETAIRYHNRAKSYKRVVLDNLAMIGRYETIRAKLIEFHN